MRKRYQLLTPEQAWERYGSGVSVEHFISDFLCEGYTDLWEMCKKYILDVIHYEDGLVTVEERTRVTKVFYRYLKTYVDGKGGMDKLELLTEEELDALWEEEVEGFLNDLRRLERKYNDLYLS